MGLTVASTAAISVHRHRIAALMVAFARQGRLMAEPMPSTDEPTRLRVRSAEDLIEAVPYLLGFRPNDSAVLVGLDRPALAEGSIGRVTVVARMDLAGLDDAFADAASGPVEVHPVPAHPVQGSLPIPRQSSANALVENAVQVLLRARTAQAVGLLYIGRTASPEGCHRAMLIVDRAARRQGLDVVEWLVAVAETDSAGRPVAPVASSRIAAEATYAGLVARPDRCALAAVLEPRPLAERERLRDRLDYARIQHRRTARSARGAAIRRSSVRALFAASRTLAVLDDPQLVWFGAALGDHDVRDACWLAIEGRRLDGEALWRELAGALPDPYAAAPAFLFGWLQWRAGHGALAAVAVERTLQADPDYRAAHLLDSALGHGLDPFRTPRLRKGA